MKEPIRYRGICILGLFIFGFFGRVSAEESEIFINFDSKYAGADIIQLSDYTERFAELDNHALAAPGSAKESLESLVAYLLSASDELTLPAETDLDKVRVIYRWITDNIAYDTAAYFSGRRAETSPAGVLRTGKSVCAGYAGLFKSLLDLAGVNSVELSGYAKGYSYDEGDHFTRTNHAWNAVEIDGIWYLIDSTWATGHLEGRTYKRDLEEYWFFTSPDKFIFSHLPTEPEWQLLDIPVSQDKFEDLPNLKSQFWNTGTTFEAAAAELNKDDFRGFPKFYSFKYDEILCLEMPLNKYLDRGEEYTFRFASEDINSMAVIQGRKFTYFEHRDGVFSITIAPNTPGTMKISYSTEGPYTTHWALIHYKAE